MKAQARADMTGVSLLLRSHRELGLHTESEEPAIGPALPDQTAYKGPAKKSMY